VIVVLGFEEVGVDVQLGVEVEAAAGRNTSLQGHVAEVALRAAARAGSCA